MAISVVPTRTDLGRYLFSVELTSVVYLIRLVWNRRDQRWYLDLLSAEGEPIRHGLKVVTNFPLLRQLIQQDRPEGWLLAINALDDNDPGLEDLGAQVKLTYVDGT
jgi:hypothetical protein